MITALANAIIFTGDEEVTNKILLIENDKIKAIVDRTNIPAGASLVDCKGYYIAPGFIDLQIYGGGGFLFSNNPTPQALKAMTEGLLKTGTTGFMLTLATNSMEIFREAICVVRDNPDPSVLGLHLEGPYINPVKRGAHIEKYIKQATKEELTSLLLEARGVIKMMTLAPEVNDPSIISLLNENGVIVSAGHSNASYEEAVTGYRNGIRATTHLFNAMSPFHHRDTGLPGAAFQTEGIYASIIADGVHVDFNTLAISKKLLQERLFLITDAVVENLEGPYVHVKQKDRYTLPDGTLSGSGITLMDAVKNCVTHAGIPLHEAIRMATLYPARLIGAKNFGKIEIGYKANLVVFNQQFELCHIYMNGIAQKLSGNDSI